MHVALAGCEDKCSSTFSLLGLSGRFLSLVHVEVLAQALCALRKDLCLTFYILLMETFETQSGCNPD